MRPRLKRIEGAPVVAARLLLAGGSRCEAIPGQALLTGRLLTEGTRRRSWEAIAAEAEGRGMILSSFGGYETHGLAIDALAADWQLALEWLAELAFGSVFPEDRLRWLARQAAAELEAQADQADLMTARAFAEQMYAPHPRGRPLQGDPASLASLDPERCREFHSAALGWGAYLSVAGEIDEAQVEALAGELFGGLPAAAGRGGDARPVPASPSTTPVARRDIFTQAEDQAHLFMGSRTVARAHPDFPALELAAVLLGTGAGLTGRIPQRIREREGLAYTATADTVGGAGIDEGRLLCYVGTAPETLDQAEAVGARRAGAIPCRAHRDAGARKRSFIPAGKRALPPRDCAAMGRPDGDVGAPRPAARRSGLDQRSDPAADGRRGGGGGAPLDRSRAPAGYAWPADISGVRSPDMMRQPMTFSSISRRRLATSRQSSFRKSSEAWGSRTSISWIVA